MKLGSRQRWLMQSIALLSLITVKPAWTQVVSDGSTGTVVVGGGVGCFPVCDITGGTSVGSNLFHSFDQFSVLGLGAARFFNNDPNIQTVISRVTGGNQSIIAGQLLPGGAVPFDLVLINPSGITFRQGADISQLQGSFIASTANSVIFPGGVEFSATSTPPPLLAINVPLGLQYEANSQPITVEASTNLTQGLPLGLPNTTLALVGSGLEVRELSRLTVRSSRMELGSVGANSFIGLVPDLSGWRLDYSAVQDNDYRDISMGELAVGTALGGDISVRGRTVTLQDGAVLSVRPLQPPFPARDGGILNVYGSLSVQVLGGFNDPLVGFVPTRLTAENLTDDQGSGWIQITTSSLEVQNGGRILSSTSGNAAGGTITIDATELELSSPQGNPFSSIASQAFGANRLGTGGNITINVDRTTVQGNAFISTSTGTQNRSGDLTITSGEFIKLIGYDNAPSTGLDAESRGEGNAGNITLTTNELIVQDYAQVTVGSQQGGNAGDLTVNAAKITMTNRGLLFGETNRTTGGNILLLPNLAISPTLAIDMNNSRVSTTANNAGLGGTITIADGSLVSLDANSRITSEAGGTATAGGIAISADTLKLRANSETSVSATGSGDAGNVEITARLVDLKASQITGTTVTGIGGNITIKDFDNLSLDDASRVSTQTDSGQAGKISITGRLVGVNPVATVSLDGASTISSEATVGNGNAGNIAIQTIATLTVQNNSKITTSVVDGTGGTIAITANDEVDLKAGSTIASEATGIGDAGAVTITTAKLSSGNSTISTSVVDGTGGTIAITANNEVDLKAGSTIASEATGIGDAGAVTITTAKLSSGNSTISTSVVNGTGGTIDINTTQQVSLTDSQVTSAATGNSGTAGTIRFTTPSLQVTNSQTTVRGAGNSAAGNLEVSAGKITLDQGIFSATTVSGSGGNIIVSGQHNQPSTELTATNASVISTTTQDGQQGGTVTIAANTVELTSNSEVSAQATGTGNAGDVRVTVDRLTASNAQLSVSAQGGQAGELVVTGKAIVLRDQAGITAETVTESSSGGNLRLLDLETLEVSNSTISASTVAGQGGSVAVQARQFILLDQDSRLEALSSGDQGRPGDVTLTSDRLTIQNNARASVSAVGIQDAGNFTITAAQVQLDNGGQLIAETAAGTGGNIDFQGLQTLTLDNNSAISTSTQDGQGGNLPITATTAISLGNQSQITAAATGRGSGGIVSLAAPVVTLQDGAAVTTTAVDGAGGSIRVNAPQSLQLARAARITTEASGNGSAGDIQLLTTVPFTPVDGVQITVSNTGTGNAGNLEVATPVLRLDRNTRLQAITNSGQGGTISFPGVIEFILDNNSVISTETKDGQGGVILVNAPNQLSLNNGSKITSSATGNGNSGDIRLTTEKPLTIANGSEVTVNSEGTGQGGTIFITANALSMTNNTLIGATTESGKGGNINIQVADSILLRFNSDILTEARGAGDGGNMVLKAGTFIGAILSEDSDIIAGAVTGMGGRIDATALLVFGFRLYSGFNTPESDFTARSQFGINGEVNLNTQTNPAPEPLPNGFAPPAIANTCSVNPAQRSSYRQMGSGGISPLPGNALTPNTVRVNLVPPVPANSAASQALSSQTISPPAVEVTNPAPLLDRIVEAQGWIRLADGTIVLTANPTLLTAYQAGLPILACGG